MTVKSMFDLLIQTDKMIVYKDHDNGNSNGKKHVPNGSWLSFISPIQIRVTISGYNNKGIVANRETGYIVHKDGNGIILRSM